MRSFFAATWWLGCSVLAACGAEPARPPVVAPTSGAAAPATGLRLPAERAINTDRFANVVVCSRCHTAGATAMRDAAGRDISPVGDWQVSMMGLAARDPYFLAALRREVSGRATAAAQEIEGLCLRCHAPTAHAEATARGQRLRLDQLLDGTDEVAELARSGVDCVGCHALEPATLGTPASYSAAAPLRTDRVVFGALREPHTEAMLVMSRTEPRYGEHVQKSELCSGCHTVLVPQLDARGPTGRVLAEQTTFLEWRASAFARGDGGVPATACQSCHMPALDDDGAPVSSVYSTRPPSGLAARSLARHSLAGGSAYLLDRLAEDPSWMGAPVSASQLRAAAARSRALLRSAASITFAPQRGELSITVHNHTGHKLPTGYPSRRMWLQVEILDAGGNVVWQSGGHERGAIVDGRGQRLDPAGVIEPHRTRLGGADARPLIWEAVPVDARGAHTHLVTAAERFAKDNRILPRGFSLAAPEAELATARGVEADTDFSAGSDTVALALPPGAARVRVALLYQAIAPETLESYRPEDGREARRFLAVTKVSPEPEVLTRAEWAAPGYLAPGGAKP